MLQKIHPRAVWEKPSHECLYFSYYVAGDFPDSPRM